MILPHRFQFTSSSKRRFSFGVALLIAIAILSNPACIAAENTQKSEQTRYLLFQIFTYDTVNGGDQKFFPPHLNIDPTVDDIITRVGEKGDRRNRLGICLGPLYLSLTDDEVKQIIRHGFSIARKKDIAIAFHIDDQMFWDKNRLLEGKDIVEWTDWKGTCSTGRRLEWGGEPMKAPPPLCLNSRSVREVVTTRARMIGKEISHQLDMLKSEGKDDLFAGVIAGWETQIGRDFDSNASTGYHALRNRGFNFDNPPQERELELADVIKEFIECWSTNLIESGVPEGKVYSHIAVAPNGATNIRSFKSESCGFATFDVAFGKTYRAGFSTYPDGNTIEQIQNQVRLRGPWASAEGNNVVPSGDPGERSMESYLGKLFNHGAVIVNIFGWGIGGEAEREKNIFRIAGENADAISSYKKFLTGLPLVEQPRVHLANPQANQMRAKLDRIQKLIPAWVKKTHRPDQAQKMMRTISDAIKANRIKDANATADKFLQMLQQ